jgi:hypothetical protein
MGGSTYWPSKRVWRSASTTRTLMRRCTCRSPSCASRQAPTPRSSHGGSRRDGSARPPRGGPRSPDRCDQRTGIRGALGPELSAQANQAAASRAIAGRACTAAGSLAAEAAAGYWHSALGAVPGPRRCHHPGYHRADLAHRDPVWQHRTCDRAFRLLRWIVGATRHARRDLSSPCHDPGPPGSQPSVTACGQ